MKKLKKQSHKLISMFLAFLMMFGCFSAWPTQVSAAELDYEIYPKPHLMDYQSGNYIIHQNVNIVYEDGIDDDTKARMKEVLAIKNINATVSDKAKEGQTNILVGIKGSNGYVDKQVSENYTLKTNGLYDKLDSYLLTSDNGTITVLGKDTDAAFYGITSLYHIFNQMDSYSIRNFVMEDYADVASRGFIEGYYGNPWSTEDRQELMKWGGYYKLNSYFYAPKDDPKHNAKWRELYSDEEIETKIKPLAQAGNESKCRFVFALHPYMNNAIRYNSEENYQADLKVMQAKFAQVIEAGVRQIAILADDAGNVGGNNYIKTLEDMTAWIKEMQKTYPDLKLTLPFCTQEYMGNGEGYYANFPENVQIVMTGGRVWGEVSNSFTTKFTNNAGRGPYMWINWPCTDNSKKHLIMGGYTTFLQPGVDPAKIQGIVLNPMQQSEPSKVAIFGNACYSWNIWQTTEEADKTWDDSFKYVDHNSAAETPASDALRELSRHMINQNMDSRVTPLQESLNIRDLLSEFKDLLNSGSTISDELLQKVKDEFVLLQKAAITYRNEASDKRVKDQIVHWLDCWDDTTTAAIAFINGIKAVQDGGDNNEIWDYYSQGQAAFDSSKTHGFHYVDHTEYAEVGVQHIVPFISTMENHLSSIVSTIVNPNQQVVSVITNRSDAAEQPTKYMLDGDNTTFAQWKTPNSATEGEYVGIKYSQAIKLSEVKFLMSNAANNNKNTFMSAKLQYTEDGIEWKDIDGKVFGNKALEINATDLDLTVKGIRVVCTEATPDIWLAIREVLVNGQSINGPKDNEYNPKVIKTGAYKVYQTYVDANLLDDSDSTIAWYQTNTGDMSLVGDFIGVDLGKVMPIDKVRFVMGSDGDFWDAYDLEYSVDGNEYTKLNSYTQSEKQKIVEEDFGQVEARYIRVRNTLAKKTWVKMAAFTVTPVIVNDVTVDSNVDALKYIAATIEESVATIVPTDSITLNKNEYIGITLPRIRDLSNIDLQLANGEKLTLQVSKNKLEWENVNLNTRVELPDARYVRLINLTGTTVTFNLEKFEIHSNEIFGPRLFDSDFGITPGWGETEDCRENGAAFDGNVDTITEFGTLPLEGQYAIYDLGQERVISKVEMYCQDSALNYLRDADILISNDLENWTKVITIGDGIENKGDANVKCIDSDAGYKASSTYPNKVSVVGTITPETARYMKIVATATNKSRAVVFNEIVINDGEYVQVANDPTFEASVTEVSGFMPQNMFDGNLTTAYRPDTDDAGYIKYTLSDNLDVKKINIVQKGTASNAKVMALVMVDGQKQWVQVGALDKSLNEIYLPFWENIYELKIEWTANNIPTISEIIVMNDSAYGADHSALTEYINSLDIKEANHTKSSYDEFVKVLDVANNVNKNNNSTPKALEDALTNLQTAVANLVTRGNKQLLKDELDKISVLDADNYTDATWESLQKVVTNTNVLLEKDDLEITLKEVSDMVEALQVAKSNLITKVSVSKEVLQNYIDTNELDTLDTSKYLTSTAKPFIDALKAAHDLISDDKATLKQLEDALTALQETRSALVLKATADEVNALKGLIDSYVETDYTASSWKDFAKVLADVNEALKGETSSEDIAKLTEDLEAAAKELVKRGDLTDINILLETAKALDENKFTADSYKKLSDVITKIEKALKDTSEMLQDEVDKLQKQLQDAINALEVKPEVIPVPGGNGTTTPEKSDSAKTGDTAMIGTFVALGMLSVAGLWLYRKKDNC